MMKMTRMVITSIEMPTATMVMTTRTRTMTMMMMKMRRKQMMHMTISLVIYQRKVLWLEKESLKQLKEYTIEKKVATVEIFGKNSCRQEDTAV